MARQFSASEGRPWKTAFFSIWTGQAFSILGSELVQFALVWYLTVETESAVVLTTAMITAIIPGVILSPFIGPLIDRWNRRKIMIVADTGISLVTLALAVLFATGLVQIWHIYVVMGLRSVGGHFHRPAMTASTSLMVPKEHLTRIQGVNQMLNGGLSIISAPLGALLLELLPMGSIVGIDVVTALLAVLPLLFVDIPQPEREPAELAETFSVFREMKEGYRYIISWRGLFIFTIVASLVNFLLMPTSSLAPLLVKSYFGRDALALGTLNAVFGISVIGGGILLSIWGGFKKQIYTTLLSLTGLGVGIAMVGIAPASMFWIAILGHLVFGLSLPIVNGSIGGILQSNVAPEMQGRVFTLGSSMAMAAAPLGLAIAGPLSEWFGLQTWFIIGGVICAIIGFGGRLMPDLVDIDNGHPDYRPELISAD